jgi:hypothetical protein
VPITLGGESEVWGTAEQAWEHWKELGAAARATFELQNNDIACSCHWKRPHVQQFVRQQWEAAYYRAAAGAAAPGAEDR